MTLTDVFSFILIVWLLYYKIIFNKLLSLSIILLSTTNEDRYAFLTIRFNKKFDTFTKRNKMIKHNLKIITKTQKLAHFIVKFTNYTCLEHERYLVSVNNKNYSRDTTGSNMSSFSILSVNFYLVKHCVCMHVA